MVDNYGYYQHASGSMGIVQSVVEDNTNILVMYYDISICRESGSSSRLSAKEMS